MTTVGLYNALTETKDIVDAKEKVLENEKQKRIQEEKEDEDEDEKQKPIQKEEVHQDRMLHAELDEFYEEMRRKAEMKMAGLNVEDEDVKEKVEKKKTGWTGPDIVIGERKTGEAVRESLEEGDRKMREGIKRDAETMKKFMGWKDEGANGAEVVKQPYSGMISGDEREHWGSFQTWGKMKLERAKMEQEALWRDAKGG